MGKSLRQKINEKTLDLNYTFYQIELTDEHRSFHPTTSGCMFSSREHEKFSRRFYMLGHETSLNKFKKIKSLKVCF